MDLAIKEMNVLDFEVANDVVLDDKDMIHKRSLSTSRVWHYSFEKESIRRQKARLKWFVEGDSNSKKFHKAMKQRFKRNFLLGINSANGRLDKVDDMK